MKLYSFMYLQEMLKIRGLRFSRPYLNTLEQSGVLPKPSSYYISRMKPTFGEVASRAYTEEEMRQCVEIIEKFTNENNSKK